MINLVFKQGFNTLGLANAVFKLLLGINRFFVSPLKKIKDQRKLCKIGSDH